MSDPAQPTASKVTFSVHTSLTEEYRSQRPVGNAGRLAVAQNANGECEVYSIGTDLNVYRIARDADDSTGWRAEMVAGSGDTAGIVSVPTRDDDSSRDRVFTVSRRRKETKNPQYGSWWFNELTVDLGGVEIDPMTRIASDASPPTGFDAELRAYAGTTGVSLTASPPDGSSATVFVPDSGSPPEWAEFLRLVDGDHKTVITGPPTVFACTAGHDSSQPLLPLFGLVDGAVALADGSTMDVDDAFYDMTPSTSPPKINDHHGHDLAVKSLSLFGSRTGAIKLLAGPLDGHGHVVGCCVTRPDGTVSVDANPTWPTAWTWLDLQIWKNNAAEPSITALEGITTRHGTDAVFLLDGIDGGVLWILVDETGASGFQHITEIATGVAHFAAGENPDGEIELFAVTNDHELMWMTRSVSGEWRNELVELPATTTANRVSAYRTTMRAIDSVSKAPVANYRVAVQSSVPIFGEVNGKHRKLDAHTSVETRTNLMGEVVVSTEIDGGLAGPTLTFAPTDAAGLVAATDRDVVELLGSVTGDELGAAVDPYSEQKIVPAKHQNSDDLDALATTVRQCIDMVPPDLTSNEPLHCDQPWMFDMTSGHPVFGLLTPDELALERSATAGHTDLPEFSLPSWGDVWEGIKTGAATVAKIVVDASTFVISFVIDGFTTVLDFAFGDDWRQIFDVIGGLFTLIGTKFGELIGWLVAKLLGFFGWDDVVENSEMLMGIVADWAKGLPAQYPDIAAMTAPAVSWLNTAKRDLDGYIDQVERSIGGTTVNQQNRNGDSIPELFSHDGSSMWGQGSMYAGKLLDFAGDGLDLGLPMPDIIGDVEGVISDFVDEIVGDAEEMLARFTASVAVLVSSEESLGTATITAVLELFRAVADEVIELMIDFIEFLASIAQLLVDGAAGLIDWLSTKIDLPFFTGFYEGLTGNDLSVLGLVCLVVAIPVTIAKEWADAADGADADLWSWMWWGMLICLAFAQFFTIGGDNVGSAPGSAGASFWLTVVAFGFGAVGSALNAADDFGGVEWGYWGTMCGALIWDLVMTGVAYFAGKSNPESGLAEMWNLLRLAVLTWIAGAVTVATVFDLATSSPDGQEIAGLLMNIFGSLAIALRDVTPFMEGEPLVVAGYTGGELLLTLILGVTHGFAAD